MKEDYNNKNKYSLELLENKFGGLEEKVEDLKSRVDDLSKINNVLIELKYLSQQQAEMIDRLFKVQVEQSDTLIEISNTTNSLGYRVSSTEGTVDDMNEKLCKQKERGTIYVSDVAKNSILLIIGAVVTAIIALII